MSTKGWEDFTQTDVARRELTHQQQAAPKSKYKNVRVLVDGFQFDSKREAGEWLRLKARQAAGEISGLQRQVRFPLYAPIFHEVSGEVSGCILVAEYVADFTYLEQGTRHVVDSKGMRTKEYRIKAKWLNLQNGITIEER